MSNNIIVGNGHHIPVIGCGHASLPNSLTLKNVLHAPKLIKNLTARIDELLEMKKKDILS
jgi:hypothetical protein